MLLRKISYNRILFVNEYWLFVPPILLGNYIIMRRIQLNKDKVKQLKALNNQIEYQNTIRKILYLGFGLNCARGGANTDFIDSNKNIIISLYKHKQRKGIAYITDHAACHLIKQQKYILLY